MRRGSGPGGARGLRLVAAVANRLARPSARLAEQHVAAAHAVFYVGTGVWPLVHRPSFERVTGPKTDFWLAQTVGVLVTAVGAGLAQSLMTKREVAPEVRTIACASALGLALVDLVFVARRRVSPIYLLDAAAEAALIAGWAHTNRPRRP